MSEKKYSEAVIEAFLTCNKLTEIAKKTGLNYSTIRRYKDDPALQEQLEARRKEYVKDASNRMRVNLDKCTEELLAIALNKKNAPQVRINAINSIYAECHNLTVLTDITERIDKLSNN